MDLDVLQSIYVLINDRQFDLLDTPVFALETSVWADPQAASSLQTNYSILGVCVSPY